MNAKNDILKRFLDTRALIDTQPLKKEDPKKDKPNMVQKPVEGEESSYRHIINTKPSKKVVIQFLREKVEQLIDDDSD
jgi:hypothetical protein